MARVGAVALARLRCGSRPIALRLHAILVHPALHRRAGQRQVDRRGEELEHHAPAVAHPLGVGLHLHSGFDLARTSGYQHARAFHLHHTDAADVDRGEGLQVAEGGRVDSAAATGLQDGAPLGDLELVTIDLDRNHPGGGSAQRGIHRRPPPLVLKRPSRMADSTAEPAVWPRPQIEASRMAWLTSASSAVSRSREPITRPLAIRCRASSCRTVPTRQGTHWPHDSSRKKRAMRSTMACKSIDSSKAITTPEPRVTPAARVASKVSGRSSWASVTKLPAAPPNSKACSFPRKPPARSMSCRRVVPMGTS